MDTGVPHARDLGKFLLPRAARLQYSERPLLRWLLAYSLVFIGFAIAHIPLVVRAGARGLVPAAAIFYADLVATHLGHLFLYGTLMALLAYTEGFFRHGSQTASETNLTIALKVALWPGALVALGLRLCGVRVDAATFCTLALVVSAELMAIAALRRYARTELVYGSERTRNVLIVGTTAATARIARCLSSAQNPARIVKGIISRHGSHFPTSGTVNDLARIAGAEFIDEVIVACGPDRDLAQEAVTEAVRNHLDVSLVPDLFMQPPSALCLQELGGMPLICVHQEPIPWLGLLLKRIMDVCVSAGLLLVLSPLLLIVAIAITIDSRGPVFFTSLRVGRKGRTFRCYKFRTMRPDAERTKDQLRARNQRQGPTFKIVNDPRITRLGRILRRYSVDELPQLWNVLTGTMSLVGPRPHPVDDYQRYSLEDRRRLDVAPGVTGLWQVTARRNPSFSINMALDLEYIENWSLGMDLAIVLKTVPAVFSGTGA